MCIVYVFYYFIFIFDDAVTIAGTWHIRHHVAVVQAARLQGCLVHLAHAAQVINWDK
jgi:hypothetical protein